MIARFARAATIHTRVQNPPSRGIESVASFRTQRLQLHPWYWDADLAGITKHNQLMPIRDLLAASHHFAICLKTSAQFKPSPGTMACDGFPYPFSLVHLSAAMNSGSRLAPFPRRFFRMLVSSPSTSSDEASFRHISLKASGGRPALGAPFSGPRPRRGSRPFRNGLPGAELRADFLTDTQATTRTRLPPFSPPFLLPSRIRFRRS